MLGIGHNCDHVSPIAHMQGIEKVWTQHIRTYVTFLKIDI